MMGDPVDTRIHGAHVCAEARYHTALTRIDDGEREKRVSKNNNDKERNSLRDATGRNLRIHIYEISSSKGP
jgi:hypothetical protein